jgi:RNA polymerase sigma-70 factor (ECF subfamily)
MFSMYGTEVRRRIAMRLPCREDVDDLAQEVFLRAHRALEVRPIDYPRAYLYQITNSVVSDHFRRSQRRCAPPHEVQSVDEESQGLQSGPTPEEILVGEQTLAKLSAALSSLPSRARQAIVLRMFEEMTYSEVAQSMGISIRTVEKHIARGMMNLRASVQ